jgi:hypothetical protein
MTSPNEMLNTRLQLLQQEVTKANSSVTMLTEQLEKAKTHSIMVQGHFNEANYLLSQFNAKPEIEAPVSQDLAPMEQPQDGEVNCESSQEVA